VKPCVFPSFTRLPWGYYLIGLRDDGWRSGRLGRRRSAVSVVFPPGAGRAPVGGRPGTKSCGWPSRRLGPCRFPRSGQWRFRCWRRVRGASAGLPIGSERVAATKALNRRLVLAVGVAGIVSMQNPLRPTCRSEPQPDFAVIKPRDYKRSLPPPEDTMLIVEVANTSLDYDRKVKLALDARSGIPEVWIVNFGCRGGRGLPITCRRWV
jgi:Putative restriction endonuclease